MSWSSLPPTLAALTGLMIWYGVFACLSAQKRWLWLWPALPLLAGALSFRLLGAYLATLHPLLAPYLAPGAPPLTRIILDIGLREEFLKLLLALPCLLLLRSRPAHLTSALVGLGFATAENRWFFTAHSEPTLLVGRIFSTTLLHAAATGLCGAALMRAWRGRSPRAWARCAATCLTVAAMHGLYDWAPASQYTWLHTGGTSWLSQLVVIALMAAFLRLHHLAPPLGSRPRSAALWLSCGAILQYALALYFTWARWPTTHALSICAQECALFLPLILSTLLCLLAVSPRAHPPSLL